MERFPSDLKVKIASYLDPRDAFRYSKTSSILFHDLALTQLPMKIPFHSWYENESSSRRRGPKIPFLPFRTHSVTLTGSWSCRLGEVPMKHNDVSQVYIVAYDSSPVKKVVSRNNNNNRNKKEQQGDDNNNNNNKENDDADFEKSSCSKGADRIVWKSKPLVLKKQRRTTRTTAADSSSNAGGWIKLTATFVPNADEEYYLCIQPGPNNNNASSNNSDHHQFWWKHSLHMSNLVAHIAYHDNPHTEFLLKRQYKTIIVKAQEKVEERSTSRALYYTRILEAVARSIRIQLARSDALDPVLESFFQTMGIPRTTDSLLVLEEIARFLSIYALVNERRQQQQQQQTIVTATTRNREDEIILGTRIGGGGSSSNRSSNNSTSPDWVPYAESSLSSSSRSTITTPDGMSTNDITTRRRRGYTAAPFSEHSAGNNHETTTTTTNVSAQKKKKKKKKRFTTWVTTTKLFSILRRKCCIRKEKKSVVPRRFSWRTEDLQATEEFSTSFSEERLCSEDNYYRK